jgi:diguanylate cyclase (GGDEF)-like protein/PAS domain S-box-containing protein
MSGSAMTSAPSDRVVPDTEALAALLRELPDPTVLIDSDGRLAWANREALRALDLRLEEAVGVSGLDLVHHDDLELALRAMVSVQGQEVGAPIEVRLRGADGWRLMELVGSPVPWLQAGAILLSLRDLTQRRRFELAHNETAVFRSLVHNSPAITMLVSPDGLVQSVSGALTRLLGHDPEHAEHTPLADLIAPSDRPAFEDALSRALEGSTSADPVRVPVHMLHHADEGSTPFELTFVNLVEDPTVGGLVVCGNDIAVRNRVESDLRNALSLLQATLDSTADGILVVDRQGHITSYNRRFAHMWHLPEDILQQGDDGRAIDFVLDQLVAPDDFLAKVEGLYSDPEAESHDTVEFRDGRVFERCSKPQSVDGAVVGRVWCFRDVTDRKELERQLSYQAFYDQLTGLSNKSLFQDRLAHAVARIRRNGGRLAVLFLDLDNFKTVNDSLGHWAGDDLLEKAAKILSDCLRVSDTAARLGGDEFAVLIEDVGGRTEVAALARRILEVFRRPIAVGTKKVSATMSIGIAYSTPGITSDQLLRNADLAMYKAKERGRNRYEEYRKAMHTKAVARLELEADLRHALECDELVPHFQPIVDLTTGSIVGLEALARWRHPHRGLLRSAEFIPFAEQIGLIADVDRHILESACRQAREFQNLGGGASPLTMSVNLSSCQSIDRGLVHHVAAIIDSSAIPPWTLMLEITESVMMRDAEAALAALGQLKSLGVRIALDDFGTGYSSLTYLERLPIDVLKIDMSFVAALESGAGNGLAPTIVQLARSLGHVAIAEGVESATQAECLRQLGCHLAQGFFYGVPQDAEATRGLLAHRRHELGDRPATDA